MNRMLSVLFLATALVAEPVEGSAQAPDPKSKPEPTETVIRLKVQAAAAPKPALKYQLLPELREMSPGNPILGYYLQCFPGNNEFLHSAKATEERDKWMEMPLKDLPVEKIREQLRASGESVLRAADEAARRNAPDWQSQFPRDYESWAVMGREVQEMRYLMDALRLRLRVEIAERRFDDALVTAKTLFAMSRHAAEYPNYIGVLVASWIADQSIESLEEMLSQPGCPNLFWALADLPQPFVDMRRAARRTRLELLGQRVRSG